MPPHKWPPAPPPVVKCKTVPLCVRNLSIEGNLMRWSFNFTSTIMQFEQDAPFMKTLGCNPVKDVNNTTIYY